MMALECRLCGDLKEEHELVINIEDKENSLACKSCKVSLELFTRFCDQIDNHQKKVERRYRLKQKLENSESYNGAKEPTTDDEDILTKTSLNSSKNYGVTVPNQSSINDNNDPKSSFCEINEDDATTVNDEHKCAETVASTSNPAKSNKLRRKIIPVLKDFSIRVERLGINYIKFDSEDELESSEDENCDLNVSPNTTLKHNSSQETNLRSPSVSPSKRMRLAQPEEKRVSSKASMAPVIPFKKEPEPASTVVKVELQNPKHRNTAATTSLYERHKQLFPVEFSQSYKDCLSIFQVPDKYKNYEDGSIYELYSKSFFDWSKLKVKCNVKSCSALEFTPKEVLDHNKKLHHGQSSLLKCFNCKHSGYASKVFDIISYMQHAIEDHNSQLRYCCFGCSKIFFNYTALYIHYNQCSSSKSLGDLCMCLHDGRVFKEFKSLQMHVKDHTIKPTVKKEKARRSSAVMIKTSPKSLNPVNQKNGLENSLCSCEICHAKYSSAYDLECHKLLHTSQAPFCEICDRKFTTNFGLIRHKESHSTNSANLM